MYKAKLNSKDVKDVHHLANRKITVDGQEYVIERFVDEESLLMVKNGTAQYKVKVHAIDRSTKTFKLVLNGIKHTVQIQDKFDLLLEDLGFNSKDSNTLKDIQAPMPGLILEVNVATGDEVKKGDKVLVLEAMKMENVIKSTGEGVVKDISVNKGDSVEKGQVLIRF